MELYGVLWGGAMGQAPPYLLVEPQQLWSSMEQLWSSMGPYGAVWSCIGLNGAVLWDCMELYGALWGSAIGRYGAGAPIPACRATA